MQMNPLLSVNVPCVCVCVCASSSSCCYLPPLSCFCRRLSSVSLTTGHLNEACSIRRLRRIRRLAYPRLFFNKYKQKIQPTKQFPMNSVNWWRWPSAPSTGSGWRQTLGWILDYLMVSFFALFLIQLSREMARRFDLFLFWNSPVLGTERRSQWGPAVSGVGNENNRWRKRAKSRPIPTTFFEIPFFEKRTLLKTWFSIVWIHFRSKLCWNSSRFLRWKQKIQRQMAVAAVVRSYKTNERSRPSAPKFEILKKELCWRVNFP